MYSVESVILALQANKILNCEGIDALGCPSPAPHEGCEGDPDHCELCQNQNCKQPVSVHNDFKKLVVLYFRFMVSSQNHSGFLDEDDSTLQKLISRKLIDKKLLRRVP